MSSATHSNDPNMSNSSFPDMASSVLESVREKDRLPLREKIGYGLGLVSDQYATVCLAIFMMPFFNDFLKMGAGAVGLAMGLARIWDAFTDPLVGSFSDRCRHPMGRRRPYILVGAIVTGLCFPLLWLAPSSWSPTALFYYLLAGLLLYYACYSLFSVPYESLGSELTPDYNERTSIYVVRTYIQQVFNLGLMWIFPLATWVGTQLRDISQMTEVEGHINGIRTVSILIAVVIIATGICPAIFCREKYAKVAIKENAVEPMSFKANLKSLISNGPLWLILGITGSYLLTIMISMSMAYYVNTYYIYGGDVQEGAILGGLDGTLRFFFSIGSAYAIKRLSERMDKHVLLMICVCILCLGFVGMYFTIIPGHPYLALIMRPFVGIGEIGFWILVISMRADVCDYDEYVTGKRREGLIAAAGNWVNKLSISAALIFGGVVLEHVVQFNNKFDVQDKLILQSSDHVAKVNVAQVKLQGKELPSGSQALPAGHRVQIKSQAKLDVQSGTNWSWSRAIDPKGEDVEANFKTLSSDTPRPSQWVSSEEISVQLVAPASISWIDGQAVLGSEALEIQLAEGTVLRSPNPKMPLQKEGAMSRLHIAYTLFPCLSLILAFVLLLKYPLSREKLKVIRLELEARRGVID